MLERFESALEKKIDIQSRFSQIKSSFQIPYSSGKISLFKELHESVNRLNRIL